MSKNLQYQLHKLQAVAEITSATLRKAVLREFAKDAKFCKAVREIMKNIKRLPLTDKQKKQVNKYARVVMAIVKRRTNGKGMQKLVVQTGDGIFLPMLIPLVAEAVRHLMKKNE